VKGKKENILNQKKYLRQFDSFFFGSVPRTSQRHGQRFPTVDEKCLDKTNVSR
jgi:hypothetical protein